MATTLFVFTPLQSEIPTTLGVYLDVVNDRPVVSFISTPSTLVRFRGVIPYAYNSGGIDVYLTYGTETATVGNVKLQTRFDRLEDGADYFTDSFDVQNDTGTVAVPGTARVIDITSVSHTNGEIDGLLQGEAFILEITRDTSVTTNATGNLELLTVELREP